MATWQMDISTLVCKEGQMRKLTPWRKKPGFVIKISLPQHLQNTPKRRANRLKSRTAEGGIYSTTYRIRHLLVCLFKQHQKVTGRKPTEAYWEFKISFLKDSGPSIRTPLDFS
jgi:hypothetical protein